MKASAVRAESCAYCNDHEDNSPCRLCGGSELAPYFGDVGLPGARKQQFMYLPDAQRLRFLFGAGELSFTVSEFTCTGYPGRAFVLDAGDNLTRLCVLVPRSGGPSRC